MKRLADNLPALLVIAAIVGLALGVAQIKGTLLDAIGAW